MPISAPQVISRSHSDLCRLDIALQDVSRSPEDRMTDVLRIATEWQQALEGTGYLARMRRLGRVPA